MSVFSYPVSFFEAISKPFRSPRGELYFQEACKIFSKQDRLVL